MNNLLLFLRGSSHWVGPLMGLIVSTSTWNGMNGTLRKVLEEWTKQRLEAVGEGAARRLPPRSRQRKSRRRYCKGLTPTWPTWLTTSATSWILLGFVIILSSFHPRPGEIFSSYVFVMLVLGERSTGPELAGSLPDGDSCSKNGRAIFCVPSCFGFCDARSLILMEGSSGWVVEKFGVRAEANSYLLGVWFFEW